MLVLSHGAYITCVHASQPDEALVSPIPPGGRGGDAPSSSSDAPAAVSGGSSPGLFDLHDSLTLHIASFLGAMDLCNLGVTCRAGRALASDDSLWRSLHLTYFGACVSAPPAGGSSTWRASYQDWRYLERTKSAPLPNRTARIPAPPYLPSSAHADP